LINGHSQSPSACLKGASNGHMADFARVMKAAWARLLIHCAHRDWLSESPKGLAKIQFKLGTLTVTELAHFSLKFLLIGSEFLW